MDINKSEVEELLKDTSFDREVSPKDERSNILVSLFKKKAFKEDSAVLTSIYPQKQEVFNDLIKQDRIELISKSPMKMYLTKIGKIVACGEFALRERERKSKKR